MLMNGKLISSLEDLKRNFSIDDLIYSYYNGELVFMLKKIGEIEKANKVSKITKNNALLLISLYEILELDPELTDDEIRASYT